MTAADFPFAVALASTMDWGMTKEDFEVSTKLEPEGCYVLFDKLNRVGISTCVSFGGVGWFGNIVIDRDHRGKGGGTLLLQKAISYLRGKGVKTIGLYAYQHLVKFYESIGFKLNREFAVFQGKTKTQRIESKLRRITERDLPAVLRFDKEFFCGDRERLLAPIILNENNQCYLSKHKDRITGYVATRIYEEMIEVGPLVCQRGHRDLAEALLRTALFTSSGRGVFVCLPSENKSLVRVLTEVGLHERFRVTRMFLGPAVAESCTYIAESLERG